MNFTATEIRSLITSIFPNIKADIVASKLKNHYLINKKELYILNNDLIYRSAGKDIQAQILVETTKLLQQSFMKLTKEETDDIVTNHNKSYQQIFKNSNVETYLPQLLVSLKSEIKFDTGFDVHFKNGYMDFTDLTFKNRVVGVHFITNCINRDYFKSTSTERKHVRSHLNKIFPNKEDFKIISLMFGAALTGRSVADQDLLMLLGEGSAGKSFILELTQLSIDCYLHKLKNDTFSLSNSKMDKILNTFVKQPQIRIAWINELTESRLDEALLKTFADGDITTTILFQDGCNVMKHMSKLFLSMNTMPNFKVDTGIVRRIKSYSPESKFTENPEEVNEIKHIYLKDKELLNKLKEGNYLNAWFDILSERGHQYLEGEKPKYNENFEKTTFGVVAANDKMQDFIDANLNITKKPNHRIGKKDMYECFRNVNTKTFMTDSQIMNGLKSKGIEYQAKFRGEDKTQGCYMGVQFSGAIDTNDIVSKDDKHYEEMDKLNKRIQQLEALLRKNNIKEIEEDEQIITHSKSEKVKKYVKKLTEEEIDILEGKETTINEEYMFVKKEKKQAKKDIECESLFDTILSSVPKQRNIEAEKQQDKLQKIADEEKKEKKAKKLTIKSKRPEITEDEEDEDIGDLLKKIKDVVKTKKSLSK